MRKYLALWLREVARDPERAPFRVTTSHGHVVYFALVVIDDGNVWACRTDFAVDQLMRKRGNLPAIAVETARQLPYRFS